MPKRKAKSSSMGTPGSESTPAERVTWLLDSVWNGNRSEMARSVGVTHSVLAKIAAGQQDPGRRLLSAVASHPKVNPAWLLTGVGAPLLAVDDAGPSSGWPVPIATQLLPGQVADYRTLLSADTFPLAGAFYRPSRYCYRLSRHSPLVKSSRPRFAEGDLLLLETDSAWWFDEEMVDDKFCVVRTKQSPDPRVGYVQSYGGDHEEPPYLDFRSYEREVDRSRRVRQATLKIVYSDGETESRELELERTAAGKRKLARSDDLPRITEPIALSDIIAVCMLVVRPQE